METQPHTIENAFQEQWQLLSGEQKELLFNIALNFNNKIGIPSRSEVPQEQWERIFKEHEAHLNGSRNYTWEEVKEMARNKEKRHGLQSRD